MPVSHGLNVRNMWEEDYFVSLEKQLSRPGLLDGAG